MKNSYESLPWIERQMLLEKMRRPNFLPPGRMMLAEGFQTNWHIRPTQVMFRPYRPKGLTQGGLYVERNEKWPDVLGHVLAVPLETPVIYDGILPGDLIYFKHLLDVPLYQDPYVGDVHLIHRSNIRGILLPNPIPWDKGAPSDEFSSHFCPGQQPFEQSSA